MPQDFPLGIDAVGFTLTLGAGPTLLVSGFLTKTIGPCIIVKFVFPWEKEGMELHILPSS